MISGRKPIHIDRLASAEGYFRALADGLRTRKAPERETMEKFTTLTGVAAPLPMRNVDTDMDDGDKD